MGTDHRRWHRAWIRSAFVLLNLVILVFVWILYFLNELVVKRLSSNGFMLWHFNDLLAMLLFLPYCNLLLALYSGRVVRMVTFESCLAFSVVVGLLWEYVTPLYYRESVSDPVDFAMYVVGGGIYGLIYRLVRKRLSLG